jgi:CheY-like chemotaxis protein
MSNESNNRILIVDDMDCIHECFRKVLSPSQEPLYSALDEIDKSLFGTVTEKKITPSYELDFAYQGNEGVSFVKKSIEKHKPYALAFVDVQMPPGDDGITTAHAIWQVDSSIQIVICSAYSKSTWQEIVQHIGDKESLYILKKPFDCTEIRQLAEALTKKWALNKMLKEPPKGSKAASERVEISEVLTALNQQLKQNFPKPGEQKS